jgi:cysteine-rich repeat protein
MFGECGDPFKTLDACKKSCGKASSSKFSSARSSSSTMPLGICCNGSQCALGACDSPYKTQGECEAACTVDPPFSSSSGFSSSVITDTSSNASSEDSSSIESSVTSSEVASSETFSEQSSEVASQSSLTSSEITSSEQSSEISSAIASSIQSSSQSSLTVIILASSSTESANDDDEDSPALTFCGDGILQRGEQCERTVDTCIDGFGCSVVSCSCVPAYENVVFKNDDEDDLTKILAEITRENETLVAAASVCGNGVLEASEECDDSNARDNDGCNSTCLLEIGICGDGVVQTLLGEQCEQSTHDSSLAYECNNCRFQSLFCGNGVVDAGEECDDGPRNSTSSDAHCRPDCSISHCGDGILDSVEICDDGNRVNDDGCDRYCRTEQTLVAGDVTVDFPETSTANVLGVQQQQQYQNPYNQQQFGFPQHPNYQQLPYQLPLAQLQPLIQTQGPIGDTGPAAVAVVASGMAAGMGWIRRRKRR